MVQNIVELKRESLRLIWVRLILGRNCRAYANFCPGNENSDEIVNAFWNGVASCVESLKISNKVVVLWDLNIRVGDQAIESICGR